MIRRSEYLTEKELSALFLNIRATRDRAIFKCLYEAALRPAEISLLQLSDWA